MTPVVAAFLEHWLKATMAAEWANFAELRSMFPSADNVKVASRRSVVIFNAARTGYRLIAAVHYDRQLVYALAFLKHSDYEKGSWKQTL